MSLVLPDAPTPDEIAVILCIASGGWLNARSAAAPTTRSRRASKQNWVEAQP
jgi:hypothetical protein